MQREEKSCNNTFKYNVSITVLLHSKQNACLKMVILKVPKCDIFDPFFYTNKSYMGR